MMNKNKEIIASQHQLEQYRASLIPNYRNLDKQVQTEVDIVLTRILSTPFSKRELCELSRMGMLEEVPLLRTHLWKLMLETLDMNPSTWVTTRQKNAELYKALKEKFLSLYIDEDDLLDLSSTTFDQQLWDEIVLDTKRTHSTLNFFQTEVSFGRVYASKPTRHCDMLSRILYIWGKTNPTVRYVQGMNEILAPIYYLEFQSLESITWDRESEVFFMFSSIMSSIIDLHIKQMDDCQSGIMGRMASLSQFLRIADKQLWQKMESQKIYPHYYSFRWLALLLAQEFSLYDTMKIWDYLFSFDGYKRVFFLFCLCISILKLRKKQIMENDFITSLPLIQKLKDIDVDKLIKLGCVFYDQYKKRNISKQYGELIAQNEKEMELAKAERNETKGKYWSYAEIVKNTGSYLTKLASWKRRDENPAHDN